MLGFSKISHANATVSKCSLEVLHDGVSCLHINPSDANSVHRSSVQCTQSLKTPLMTSSPYAIRYLNDGIFLNQNVMNIRVSRVRLLSLWNFEALF